jgi:hypothetical protein
MHLLLKASSTNRIYRDIKLNKGQLITSISLLSEQTGLTVKQVRNCLDKLKRTNEIAVHTNRQYSLITVKKWADYQGFSTDNTEEKDTQKASQGQTKDTPRANDGQTKDKQRATVKEREKESIKNNNLTVITKNTNKSSRKTGTRFISTRDENDNAIIPDEYYRYAAKQGMDHNLINIEFQKFANYWETTTKNPTKLDWFKTWQNWILNNYSSSNQSQTSFKPKSDTYSAMKEVDCMIEQSGFGDVRPPSAYLQGE